MSGDHAEKGVRAMRKILMAVAVLAFMGTVAQGQAAVSSPSDEGSSYLTVLKACGAEWKARADKTVKGMAAWQEFRKTCTTEKGWVAKGGRKKGGKATPDTDKG